MLKSMTGYGSASERFAFSTGELELTIELKSLNSKYLDLQLRAPRLYMAWESKLGAIVRKGLTRGRVELYVTRQVLSGESSQVKANVTQVKAYYKAMEQVRNELGLKDQIGLGELMNFPDWLQTQEVLQSAEEEWPALKKLVEMALQRLVETRAEEGQALSKLLESHRSEAQTRFQHFEAQKAKLPQQLRSRWRERLQELAQGEQMDRSRLEQELVFLAGKSDFSEEVDRLHHHLGAFEQLLNKGDECGRRLEFLTQEMQREVNTLGSKCSDAALISELIELKSVVEKIREQALNVE